MTTHASVLVVDDDRLNRLMLTKLLEHDRYDVRTAVDGREALDTLRDRAFDLVLLDLVMPEVDGIEVLQTLKCNSQWWDMPVIMISAVEETSSIVRCIELGAEDYLLKPFDPVLLRARVNASLARKRFHDLEVEYHSIVKEQRAELQELNRQLTRRAWAEVSEVERLNRLRRFLPARLAEEIVSSGDDPFQPHRGQIVVLAAALDGLGSFAGQAEPDAAITVLDDFHLTVESLVDRFEATLGCGPGDGVTVFFNDPVPCSDPLTRAVKMAVALTQEMPGRLLAWRQRHACELNWGAGISLGEAVLGRVGGESRWEYSAIGPVVDSATRLRDRARSDGTVLLDGPAAAAAEGLVELEHVDSSTHRVGDLRSLSADAN